MLKKSCFQGNNHYIPWSKFENTGHRLSMTCMMTFLGFLFFVSMILSYIALKSACLVLVGGGNKWITDLLFWSLMTPFVNKIFKMIIYVNLISKILYLNKLKFSFRVDLQWWKLPQVTDKFITCLHYFTQIWLSDIHFHILVAKGDKHLIHHIPVNFLGWNRFQNHFCVYISFYKFTYIYNPIPVNN